MLALPCPGDWAIAFPTPVLPPAINTPSSCCPKLGKAQTNPSPPTFFLCELPQPLSGFPSSGSRRGTGRPCAEPGCTKAEPGWAKNPRGDAWREGLEVVDCNKCLEVASKDTWCGPCKVPALCSWWLSCVPGCAWLLLSLPQSRAAASCRHEPQFFGGGVRTGRLRTPLVPPGRGYRRAQRSHRAGCDTWNSRRSLILTAF